MERHQELTVLRQPYMQEHTLKIHLDPLPPELTVCAQGHRLGKDGLVRAAPSGRCMPLCPDLKPPLCPRLLVLGLASWILSSNSWWACVLARKNKLAGLAETLKLKQTHPRTWAVFCGHL